MTRTASVSNKPATPHPIWPHQSRHRYNPRVLTSKVLFDCPRHGSRQTTSPLFRSTCQFTNTLNNREAPG
jgi:hypothetical protein